MDNEKITFKSLSFTAKIQHIWEYYKFRIIVGIFIILISTILIIQFASRIDPDANIMYAGEYNISAQAINDMKNSLSEKVMKTDANDDGKKAIDYTQFLLFGEIKDPSNYVNSVTMQENLEGYNAEILAGDSMILFLDQYYFDTNVANGLIMPFEEYLDEVPEQAMDAYGIKISELDIYKISGFMKFSPDTIVCMRVQKTYGNFGKGEATELLERNIAVFKDIISYSYSE